MADELEARSPDQELLQQGQELWTDAASCARMLSRYVVANIELQDRLDRLATILEMAKERRSVNDMRSFVIDAMTIIKGRMQRETIGAIQNRATADEILARIVGDIRNLNQTWSAVDVDMRNQLVSCWRAKIISELERYF